MSDRPLPPGGRSRKPAIVAILACHNRRELTLRALRSWFSQRPDGADLAAVLVDDGSIDGTAAAVRLQFPDVRVLTGDGSLYWAAGMAMAEHHARALDPAAIVWLNDDVLLDDRCLPTLRGTSARYAPPAVVAGAVADPVTGQPTYGGFSPNRWHPLRGSLIPPSGRPEPVPAAHGNLLYVPREAYRQAGIDGNFEHAYADLDYTLRLRRLRYPVVLTPDIVGWCSRTRTHPAAPVAGSRLQRVRDLNSPLGVPIRSHLRFLRRHGGVLWPALVPLPYLKELVARQGRRGTGPVQQKP